MRRVVLLALPAIGALTYFACSSPPPTVLETPPAAAGPTWTELLQRYVDDDGLVDYRRWKADGTADLDGVLARMSASNPEAMPREEAMALWINVYNALTIRAILEFYPLKSIKEKVGLIGYNVWKDYRLTVGGREVSLDEIEHKILRPMSEPRIHFAVNCASMGCPKLRREAYEAARIEEQLEEQARAFFADERHFTIDVDTRTAYVSSILQWFAEDFGEVREFIAGYIDERFAGYMRTRGIGLKYLKYDWSINEQTQR